MLQPPSYGKPPANKVGYNQQANKTFQQMDTQNQQANKSPIRKEAYNQQAGKPSIKKEAHKYPFTWHRHTQQSFEGLALKVQETVEASFFLPLVLSEHLIRRAPSNLADEFSKWLDNLKGVLRMKLHEFKYSLESVYSQFGLKEGGELYNHCYAIINGDFSPVKRLPSNSNAVLELYKYLEMVNQKKDHPNHGASQQAYKNQDSSMQNQMNKALQDYLSKQQDVASPNVTQFPQMDDSLLDLANGLQQQSYPERQEQFYERDYKDQRDYIPVDRSQGPEIYKRLKKKQSKPSIEPKIEKAVLEFMETDLKIRNLAVSRDGRYIAVGSDSGQIRKYNLKTQEILDDFQEESAIDGLTFTRNNTLVHSDQNRLNLRTDCGCKASYPTKGKLTYFNSSRLQILENDENPKKDTLIYWQDNGTIVRLSLYFLNQVTVPDLFPKSHQLKYFQYLNSFNEVLYTTYDGQWDNKHDHKNVFVYNFESKERYECKIQLGKDHLYDLVVPLKFTVNEDQQVVAFGHQLNKFGQGGQEARPVGLITLHSYNPIKGLPIVHKIEPRKVGMEIWNLSFFSKGDWLIGTNINSTLFYLKVNHDKKRLEEVTETINISKDIITSMELHNKKVYLGSHNMTISRTKFNRAYFTPKLVVKKPKKYKQM